MKPGITGRGAQLNSNNKFSKYNISDADGEYLDHVGEETSQIQTTFYYETPRKIINKVDSPDVRMDYSVNPYQGCEHGCIYCYARNSHEYWGFSAGVDFESKIIIKKNAAELLANQLQHPKWKPACITFSGNTDCYQPIERKLKITRNMLQVMLEYKNPVSIITKNALILRDIDILKELAKLNLIYVMISITTLNEDTRRKLEPRTASAANRLKVIETLSENNIPAGVMVAPVIPGLTDHEMTAIIKEAGTRGAKTAGYTVVRLNGSIAQIFEDSVKIKFPGKADKILNQIADCHSGKLNDSRWGTRMRGTGNFAEIIKQVFIVSCKKYLPQNFKFEFDYSHFRRKEEGQLDLFSK